MADPSIDSGSNMMADDGNLSASGHRSNVGRGYILARELSGAELLHKDIRNKWSFDYINNHGCPPLDPNAETIVQAQFAYYHWTEKLKESVQREDRKKSDRRDYQTEIYQMIGFYSVFQGVIFQGVTAMASQMACGFYRIPVILSVLSSAATFIGIYDKFGKIEFLNRSINEDEMLTQACQHRIAKVEKFNHVKEFDINQIEPKSNNGSDQQNSGEQHSHLLKWSVLGFLIVFSSFFAYLDFVVMCRGYH